MTDFGIHVHDSDRPFNTAQTLLQTKRDEGRLYVEYVEWDLVQFENFET